ncbi:DUF3284 domain-containing protein [Vagococcus fluvialis]|uniref:DUF3284 domain-containing protein n=1 Tax=Vagococcus fluvialis TaxID=2738 RepID=UPI003B5BC16D
MKISKELNIPATYFYNKLVESVLYDVRKNTGEGISETDLEGVEYVKQFGSKDFARVTIEKLVPNTAYAYSTSTNRNNFNASYEIKQTGEQSCLVEYEEKMISHGTLQKFNDSLFQFVLGKIKKKRFIKMLEQMEESY